MTTKRGTASQVTGGYVEFQTAVLRALPRDIDVDVAFNWTQNGEVLSRVLREVFLPAVKQLAGNSYPLSVNYERSVEDAVKLGRYDWANGDITSNNFPTKRTGTVDIVVEFIHFDRHISTEDVQKEFDNIGYRPVEIHELLAFGEKYPDIQREFPIISLGFVWWNRSGCRCVPYLGRFGSERSLDLYWIEEDDWSGSRRFAAVRK